MENAFDASRSAGLVVIGIEELSKIIGLSKATITKWASTNPEKLPPRLKTGTCSARWLLADVWVWLQQRRAETPAPAVPPAPPVTTKNRRGRPLESVRIAAQRAGMTTKDYISSQQGV